MNIFDYIENLSNRIGAKIGKNDSEDYVEAYQYCVFFLLSHTLTFGTGLILSFIFGYTIQYTVCTLTFMILRISAGGYHCETFKNCFFTTNTLMILGVIIASISQDYYIITVIISFIAAFSVMPVVPRPTENSPSRGYDGDIRFRRKYKNTVLLLMICIAIFASLGLHVVCTSISAGIIIVSLMISDTGDSILNLI